MGENELADWPRRYLREITEQNIDCKRQANHASQVAINYENVRPLTGKLMGAHNDGYGSRWT